MLRKDAIFILMIIAGLGCDSQPKTSAETKESQSLEDQSDFSINDKSDTKLSFTKSMVFGESDEILFRNVGNIAVDESGHVFIADRNSIKVFNPNGSYKLELGRKGRGPGEFNNVGPLIPKIKNNTLYVYDEVLKRINIYSLTDFNFTHSIIISPSNWNHIDELQSVSFVDYFVLNESLLLASFADPMIRGTKGKRKRRYFQMNMSGDNVSNEIFNHSDLNFYSGTGAPGPIPPESIASVNLPSTRSSIVKLDSKNSIHHIFTGEFVIERFDSLGAFQNEIRHTFNNSDLNRNEVVDMFRDNDRLLKRVGSYDFPETWPAIDYFFIDDRDRLWVSTITDSEDSFEWWVLSNEGQVIGKFNWSGSRLQRHFQEREIRIVNDNFLYTVEVNDSTNQKEVIRYKIDF
ncbi:MAG TPA: hypothetical protein DCE78_04415 [Bacteroidetes bacterium]|nr:hypothetical protein [Bacteroidota bacterium]